MFKDVKERNTILEEIRTVYFSERWSNGVFTEGIGYAVASHILDINYYSLPCCNGTVAISVAINIISHIKNKKVTVAIPVMSSMAVKFAVQSCNANIIYYPLDLHWNANLEDIYEEIDILLIVHSGGLIEKNIKEISKICNEKNICLIEDISHSQCSEKDGVIAGVNSDFTVFSMYATKSLNSGEGGIVAYNTKSNCKFNLAVENVMYQVWNAGRDQYENQILFEHCFNARVSEFQAAIMLNRIENYSFELNDRYKKAKKIDEVISNDYTLHHSYSKYSFYKYIIMTTKANELKKNIKKSCFTGSLYPNFLIEVEYEDPFKDMFLLRDNHVCINLDIEIEDLLKIKKILES